MNQHNRSSTVYRRLAAYMYPHRSQFTLALVCALISIAFSLAGPILIGKAVDRMVGAGRVDFTGVAEILLILAATILLSALFQWLLTLAANKITYRTVKQLRRETFEKLSRIPLKRIDTQAHGDLISRIVNDVDQIATGLLSVMTQLFTGIVTVLGTLLFMLYIHWAIALVVVLLTPLSFFVASKISKNSHEKFREQTRVQGELSGYIEEMVGNQRIVKAFTHEKKSQQTFEEINGRLYQSGVKAQFYSSLTNPSTRFVNNIIYAAVGITGALMAISGRLSIGQISSFLSYANQYTKPFNEITGVIPQLQAATASAQRVFSVLDEEEETPDIASTPERKGKGAAMDAPSAMNAPSPPRAKTPASDAPHGEVVFDHVSFSYTPERPFIEDLNIHVNPGQSVAIVGPTGCGKTTLINLLMRFYEVTAGEIRIDGIPIQNMTRQALRSQFGMVLQDTWLYGATIRDNIAYSKPEAPMDEVVAAAKAVHAHGFIRRLEDGYDTVVSENGGNLSQGQKQLLCIARVMLLNPPMLILDEATSNIDTRTEIRIQEAFDKLTEGRTSFVVAHRLSTIQNADLILVMKDGKILQTGTHEQLLHSGGFYAELWNSQFRTPQSERAI